MRGSIRKLVFVSLLLLVSVNPRPVSEPPLITPSGTAEPDLSLLRKLLDEQAYVEAVYREAASKPIAKKATARASAGGGASYAPASYEPGSIEGLICSVFGASCSKAIAVARCESGLNPAARNRSGASGLFQIMMPMHADLFNRPEDVFDPLENSRAAFALSRGGVSWSAWVCR